MTELPLETEVLRAPLARRFAAAPPRDLAPLLAGVGWDRFLWLGLKHRVLIAWRHALHPHEVALVPPDILAQIQALAEVNQLRVLARARECCHLQDLLAQHRIDAIALSGWALAQRHHAQPFHREIEPATAYSVRAADQARAEEVFAAAGYPRPDRLRLPQRNRSDLWLLPPYLAGGAAGEAQATLAWPRTERWEFSGRPFRLLDPLDWLLRLCARGADHLWQPLSRCLDLAELLRAQPSLDWTELGARADSLGLQRALLLGVGVVSAILEVPLPASLRTRLATEPDVAAAIAGLDRRFRSGTIDALPENDACSLRSLFGLEPLTTAAKDNPAPTLGRYAPTPESLVTLMLELAEVGPGDVVYDLGCGDGRFVAASAQRGATRGVGVDLDPQRITEAEARAAHAGLPADRVRFVGADLRDVPLGDATVVCLYLQDFAYDELRPKLQAELPPGARVVSHRFTFASWIPEKCLLVRTAPDQFSSVYLWRVGARS